MQHTLLALAIALIAAIAAALAAPAIVDWNNWRGVFEARATQLVGARVTIRGRIDAALLPTPAFVLRNVEIGEPDRGTGARAGEVRGSISLAALLRGAIEAEEFEVVRPEMRLMVEPDGQVALPKGAGAAASLIAASRFAVSRGSLVVEDRALGVLAIFDEISAAGEVFSRQGPMRFDASLRRDGRRWQVRAGAGRFGDDAAGRLRVSIERPDDGTLFEADGSLALAAGARFEGRVQVARRGPPGIAWRVGAQARASAEQVSLDGFELTLGVDAAPTVLAGKLQFAPKRGGGIEGALSARRLDFDRSLGADGARGLAVALAAAREAAAQIDGVPLTGNVSLSVDALSVGGGAVRDLRADVALRDRTLVLDRLEARLPGQASIRASGVGARAAAFAGGVVLEADDAAALVRWAMSEEAAHWVEAGESLRVAGEVHWTAQRFAVQQLEFALGAAKLGGRFALVPAAGTRRAQIDTQLTAEGIDLALLAPLAQRLWAGTGGFDVALEFQGRTLRALGRPLARVEAALSRSGAGVEVRRLRIEDFDGVGVKAEGRIAGTADRPDGRIGFEIEATRAGGLTAVAEAFAGREVASLVRRVAAGGLPLHLKGAALGQRSAAGISVTASGRVGEADANVDIHIDSDTEALAEAQVTLFADEAGKLTALFGVEPGTARGESRLELLASSVRGGALPVRLRLTAPGAEFVAEGEVKFGADGRLDPRLDLRVEAADLRALLASTGAASAVPAKGGARLVRRGEALSLEVLALEVAGAPIRGALSIGGLEKPALAGKLSLGRADLGTLISLSVGRRRSGDGQPWPDAPLAAASLEGATGAIDIEAREFVLADNLVATDARFRLRLGVADAAIEAFAAQLAGGKLTGQARFLRGETLGIDARVLLSDFQVARLLARITEQPAARGRGSASLAVSGSGRTPAAAAASLAGQGMIVVEGLEIDRLDPGALAAVLSATEGGAPPDELALIELLSPALAKGPLRFDKAEAPVTVAAGVLRTGRVRSEIGSVEAAGEAMLDVVRLRVDGAVDLDAPAEPSLSARPGITVRWRGPLEAPERSVEATALATAIALRAMEREQKAIEERDRAAALPRAPATPPVRPPAADVPTSTVPAAAAKENRQPARSREPNARAAPPLPPPVDIRPAPRIAPPQ